MKALIVDDQIDNRKLLRDILESHATCDLVSNGLEAVKTFEMELTGGEPYDLVLLDIMMPVMDGQEALKQMRAVEREQKVPASEEAVIIMVTALDSPKPVTEAFFKGFCTDYVSKPLRPKVLLDKLAEYGLIEA
ncbi:MAG: response regulator [Magnetococcales bacterium]|nr:response regulator [Magnetococcales bacterium]